MSALNEALVLAVTHLLQCSDHHSAEQQFEDGVVLGTIGKLLRGLDGVALNDPAAAAELALAAERSRGELANPRRIEILQSWMAQIVDDEWSGDPPSGTVILAAIRRRQRSHGSRAQREIAPASWITC